MSTLKQNYQIQTIPAYKAADGREFLDLDAAQAYTREKMLTATINAAIKDRPDYARLDTGLLLDFLLLTGKHVGLVMAEPLQPTTEAERRPSSLPAHAAAAYGTTSAAQAKMPAVGLKELLNDVDQDISAEAISELDRELRSAMAQ